MDTLDDIRNAIRSMKAEALDANRSDVNRGFVDDMMQAYERLTSADLSGADRERTLGMLHAVSTIKRFIEMGEMDQVQLRLRSITISYV